MNTCYDGIGYLAVTVPAGTCGAGQVCMMNTAGQADACSSGGRFMGVCDEVRKGLAAVQVGGFAKVKYSGSAPALGFAKLAADGAGGVCVSSSGQEHLVVALDEANLYITIKL